MNPQLRSNQFESNDPSSDLINQVTSCNLSFSSTHSNLEPHSRTSTILSAKTTTRRLIHSSFIQLKKTLGLTKFQRKTQIDSLLKKCKSKAFKTIHEGIKRCFTKKLKRLPQEFITNIKIDFNKKYLSKSIIEIYKENNILSSFDEMKAKGSIEENKQWALEEFLQMTLKEVFDYYVHSKQFISDYKHIAQREGEKFAMLFYFISNVFIMYYTRAKGNRPKCLKGSKQGIEVDNTQTKDIFTIQKRARGNFTYEREDTDSIDQYHQHTQGNCSQSNSRNNNRSHQYFLLGTEQFAPVSIIANEELI